MSEKPSLSRTETVSSRTFPTVSRSITKTAQSRLQVRRYTGLGHIFVGVWAVTAAIATATQTNLAQLLERQTQTLFFELRGPVAPPSNIVILGMDEDSIVQGSQIYPTDRQKYAYLQPLSTSPPQRSAYTVVIDRLMAAGAKAIALDVVLDAPGDDRAQDEQLQTVLNKYAEHVVLAAMYDDKDNQTYRAGDLTQLLPPNEIFRSDNIKVGFINYPKEPDGRIHRLGSQFPKLIAQSYPPDLAAEFLRLSQQTPAFAETALQAARLEYPSPSGQTIFFYGPQGTFPQIPFWHVLEPTNWAMHQKQGTFKDKIVLIGPTAELYRDFHAAPFSDSFLYRASKLTGVEIHANAIATLLEGKAIREVIPNLPLQGVMVLALVAAAGYVQSKGKRSLHRVLFAAGLALAWGGITYIVFAYGRNSLPAAVPMVAIALSGVSYLVTGSVSEYLRKFQLRQTLQHYAGSPIVQEIISQQDEFQDLLKERELAILHKQLAGRYKIAKLLGAGGFGETYIAEDTQRPGNPLCVVKQLRPASNNPKLLQLARRLFLREAETLEKLGEHKQIPQLLAYFEEEEEFYLVQEYVEGHSLSSELSLGRQLPEARVIVMLQELLQILEFVHSRGVIHRDIKPSNVIRRRLDGRLVLIDFGAVKEIQQLAEESATEGEHSSFTVGIGTQGYMPSEQCAGVPRLNSDIYAVGMTGIQALTGVPPSQLKQDPETGEILWRHRARVSHTLADVLSRMVCYDYRKRYQSATEVLHAVRHLTIFAFSPPSVLDPVTRPILPVEAENAIAASTQPWPDTFASEPLLPPTEDPLEQPTE